MAFYTIDSFRQGGLRAAGTRRGAEQQMSKSIQASTYTHFDVFLSHSFLDAEVVYGVVRVLESQGLSVYVDWIVDRQLSRENVSSSTAGVLRGRMRQCNSLIFAVSDGSPASKWMPWELGYFDGMRGDRIAIMPLISRAGASGFPGQEYLGLYPAVESDQFGSPKLSRQDGRVVASAGMSFSEWAKS